MAEPKSLNLINDLRKLIPLNVRAMSDFALGGGGQKGVESLLQKMKEEINRDMILMGCKSVKDLNRSKIVFRKK